jgi:rSAM/selenodomain-associated transferase 2
MPAISFVIPALNEQAGIDRLLRQLRRSFPTAELIVVDGGSGDGTVPRAMPLCDQLLIGERGRALQMNLGGRVARGDWLCFLHADSIPQFDERLLMRYLDAGGSWGFCRARLSGGHWLFRVIEWFMNQRSRLSGIGTGDQMLFVSRKLFIDSGGFDAIPLMEDVAYCRRLRRRQRPLIVTDPVTTSSRRWEEHGIVATVVRMWLLRLAYFLGVSPQRLRQYYAA